MQALTSFVETTLFPEKNPPPLLRSTRGDDPGQIEDALWRNAHSYDVGLQHLELEVRLGRLGPRNFAPGVSQLQFEAAMSGLQAYAQWDSQHTERSVVSYFERRDANLRVVHRGDGSVEAVSKRKLHLSDFVIRDAPFDMRIASSLELPVTARPPDASCTRRVVRDRSTFALGNWRYDLTRVTFDDGREPVEYHIELELIDPLSVQLSVHDATRLTRELYQRITDLVRVVDAEASDVRLEHRRERWF